MSNAEMPANSLNDVLPPSCPQADVPQGAVPVSSPMTTHSDLPVFKNYEPSSQEANKRAGRPISDLYTGLMSLTDGWPKRIGDQLFATSPDDAALWLKKPSQLNAWLSNFARVDWAGGTDMVKPDQFFEYLKMTCHSSQALENAPHFPPLPDTYYLHPALPQSDGSCFVHLLDSFCPATPADRELIKAFYFTLFWGGKPGTRPAWLITSPDDDPKGGVGVGKSTFVELAAELVGTGYLDVVLGEDTRELKARLLSPSGRHQRIERIDNVKDRVNWADLEALITSPIISGHQLYTGESSRPNNLVCCLTLNAGILSRDMAQRCVIIHLKRPANAPDWAAQTLQFIKEHRLEIIADIGNALNAPQNVVPALTAFSRWAAWEQAVLARVGNPEQCQNLIRQRQQAVDDDAGEAELVEIEFRQQLGERGHDPDKDCVFIPSKIAAAWLKTATGQHRATNYASKYLNILRVPGLKKSRKDGIPGWCWRPSGAVADAAMARLGEPREAHKAAY